MPYSNGSEPIGVIIEHERRQKRIFFSTLKSFIIDNGDIRFLDTEVLGNLRTLNAKREIVKFRAVMANDA